MTHFVAIDIFAFVGFLFVICLTLSLLNFPARLFINISFSLISLYKWYCMAPLVNNCKNSKRRVPSAYKEHQYVIRFSYEHWYVNLLSNTFLDIKVKEVETESFQSNKGSPPGDSISRIFLNRNLEDSLRRARCEFNLKKPESTHTGRLRNLARRKKLFMLMTPILSWKLRKKRRAW